MQLEYVASGNAGVKYLSRFIVEDAGSLGICREYIQAMDQKLPHHNFSMLFNAFTERQLGQRMKEYYDDDLYKIHADSGGLQIVTLGKQIDDKSTIFDTQSKYSDIAMSFDEIPVYLPDGKATIQGSGARIYDPALLVPKAKQSGVNLREQLRYFAKIKSKAKVFLILQGRDLASYQTWLDLIWEEIKDEDLSYLGGIASAAAALGSGIAENYKRAFICSQLKYPDEMKNMPIHVLGVGAIYRLLPFLVTPFYQEKHLSYDSTSFTKMMFNAGWYDDYSARTFSEFNREAESEHISNLYNQTLVKYGLPELTSEAIFQYQMTSGGDIKEIVEKDIERFTHTRMGFFAAMIFKFYEECDQILSGDIDQFFIDKRPKHIPVVRSFVKIRDEQDFNEWMSIYGMMLPSNSYDVLGEKNTHALF